VAERLKRFAPGPKEVQDTTLAIGHGGKPTLLLLGPTPSNPHGHKLLLKPFTYEAYYVYAKACGRGVEMQVQCHCGNVLHAEIKERLKPDQELRIRCLYCPGGVLVIG